MNKKNRKIILIPIAVICLLLFIGCNNKIAVGQPNPTHKVSSGQDALVKKMEIQSADGTIFELKFDMETQCGIPRSCRKDRNHECMEIPLNNFLYTSKDGEKMIPVMAVSVPGSGCPSFVVRDEAKNTTCYCSGGRCWCPTR